MRYPYRHPMTGEEREIVCSMRNPPPEEVLIYEDRNWVAAENPDGSRHEFDPADERKHLYLRVYLPVASVVKGDDAIVHKGKKGPQHHVSKAMPLEHEPTTLATLHGSTVRFNQERGVYSTLGGERIVRNRRDRAEHLKACRMEDQR